MKPTLHSFTPGSRLNHWRQLLLASLCVTAIHAGSAQTIYKTGFDKPFIADAPLNGQDGWVAPPPLSANAAVITEEKPHIGRQTVEVRGADLVPQDFINEATGGYYEAIGSYRRAVNHDTGGTQTVTVSAFVRVDGSATPAGNNFFSASIAARASLTNGDHAGVGELAISSDGHVYGYSGNEDVPTFQTSKPLALGKWHLLSIEINFAAQTYSFRVNGKLEGEFPFDANVDEDGSPVGYTNVLLRGSLITYAAPDAGELQKADYVARFDQFSIKAKDE
jgi:hypothetical protein